MSVQMRHPAGKRKLSGNQRLDQDWKDAWSDHFVQQHLKRIEVREFPKRETLEPARQRNQEVNQSRCYS